MTYLFITYLFISLVITCKLLFASDKETELLKRKLPPHPLLFITLTIVTGLLTPLVFVAQWVSIFYYLFIKRPKNDNI